MVKKPKINKPKDGDTIDNVDTTLLNIKQLQSFCERVYKEIVRTERENRGLELERNKLKTMVDISTQELIKAIKVQRQRDFELGETCQTTTSDKMKLQNCVRNVRNEKIKNTLLCTRVTRNNLKILRKDSTEYRHEIENDVKNLRNKIFQQDKHRSDKFIKLKKELEIEKSNLCNTYDNESKLQLVLYEKQCLDFSKKHNKESFESLKNFSTYKNRKINTYLKDTHNLHTVLQNYYEKLNESNMNLLVKMQEKCKLEKNGFKNVKTNLNILKDTAEKIYIELEKNKKDIKGLNSRLADSKRDRRVLKDMKLHVISGQTHLKNMQWDNLVLEEALGIMNKEHVEVFQFYEQNNLALQKNITKKLLVLECWAKKLKLFLNAINNIMSTRNKKIEKHVHVALVKEIAFAQLEKEAKRELVEEHRLKSNIQCYQPF